MALHESQPLTQAIQDAPVTMTEEESQKRYTGYLFFGKYHETPGATLPFHEWLTVNRIRIS